MNLSEMGAVFHESDGIPRPSFTFTFDESTSFQKNHSEQTHYIGKVTLNERMTSLSHFQDVRRLHITVQPSSTSTLFWYNAGDVLTIKPKNIPSEVQAFIDHLGYTSIADKPLTLHSNYPHSNTPLPQTTLRTILETELDIFGLPKRHFFKLLSQFTTNTTHANKLHELSTSECSDEFIAYTTKPRRTIYEILKDFEVVIPVAFIYDLIPVLKTRSFSIASTCEVCDFLEKKSFLEVRWGGSIVCCGC